MATRFWIREIIIYSSFQHNRFKHLTRYGLDKIDTILHTLFFEYMNKDVCISINTSLNFASKGQHNSKTLLVQLMVRCRKGDKTVGSELGLPEIKGE